MSTEEVEDKDLTQDTETDGKGRLISVLVPVFLTLLFVLIPFFSKKPVYALNDDLQIRDILSGAYSGNPDLHTVYMGAVLSAVLALLYTVLPFVPWYGLFLCLAPAVVFLLISLKVMKSEKIMLIKVLGLCMLSGLYLWYLYPVIIMPHYTLAAAVFAAGGLWLMMDHEITGGLILFLICQQVRQQVFLMLLPFAAAVILLSFLEDKDRRRELIKPLSVFVISLGILIIINSLAYAGAHWREYLKLNDARTQLYDYTGVWESSAARKHYSDAGVSEDDYVFFREYDLLPVIGADTATLYAMAGYREEGRQPEGAERLKDVLRSLERIYLLSDGKELVYAYGLLLMYALAISNSLYRGKGWGVLFLLGCFVTGLGIHAFLLWKGRAPERVTVSLFMAQCFMIGGMVQRYTLLQRQAYWAIEGAILTIVLSQAFNVAADLNTVYEKQITVNNEDDVVYSYMAEYADQLFVAETYALVDDTAFVFDTDRTENCILMGGWQYMSPLQDKKLKAFGYADRSEVFKKSGARMVFRRGDGIEPEIVDAYLGKVFGTGLKFDKELPGNLEVYVIE